MIYTHVIHTPSKPADGNASNLWDAVYLGYEHAEHANIVGEGLQSLQEDKSLQAAQDKIIEDIIDESFYRQEAYIPEDKFERFTANGSSGNWEQAAKEFNQAFWMVHTAIVSTTDTRVAADGTITTTWVVSDDFDYLPDFRNKGLEYNFFAVLISFGYNVVLGAKTQYPTTATWTEVIPPQLPTGEKSSSRNRRTLGLDR